MPTPILFLYNIDKEKENAIRRSCMKLKIKVHNVDKSQQYVKIADLLMQPSQKDEIVTDDRFDDEMLLFANFTGDILGKTLKVIPRVFLKATLTEHNINWNSYRLYSEIKQEHEYYLKLAQDKKLAQENSNNQ